MYNFLKVYNNENNIQHFIHERTGLNVLFFHNADKNLSFNISVKNLPYDNKGLPHILEHIILSDSYEYENAFEFATNNYTNSYLNAITDKDITYYLVSSFFEDDFYNLSKIYSDCILNPKFSNKTFELEVYNKKTDSGAIYAEMTDMFKDDMFTSIEIANEKFYNDNEYKYCPYGVVEEIKKTTLDDCVDYYNEVYKNKNNIVVVATGQVDINKILKILDGSISKQEKTVQKNSTKKHINNKNAKYNKKVNYGSLITETLSDKNIHNKKEIIITKIIHNNQLEKYAYKIVLDYLKENYSFCIVDYKYFDNCFNVYSYKNDKNEKNEYVVNEDVKSFYNYLQKIKYKFKIKDYGYKNESLVNSMHIADDFLSRREISVVDNEEIISFLEKNGLELLKKVYETIGVQPFKKSLDLAEKNTEQKNITSKNAKENVETFLHEVVKSKSFQNLEDYNCFFESNINETFVYISLQFSTTCDILKSIDLIGFYSLVKSIEALNLLDSDTKILIDDARKQAMFYFVFDENTLFSEDKSIAFDTISHSQFTARLINDYNRYKVLGVSNFNQLEFNNIMKSYYFNLHSLKVGEEEIYMLGQYILNEYLLKELRNGDNALCYNVLMFVESLADSTKVLSFYVESPTDRQQIITTFNGIIKFLSHDFDIETFNKTKNSIINELEKKTFSYGKIQLFKKNNKFCPNLGIIIEKLKKIMYNETKQFIDIVERGGYFG